MNFHKSCTSAASWRCQNFQLLRFLNLSPLFLFFFPLERSLLRRPDLQVQLKDTRTWMDRCSTGTAPRETVQLPFRHISCLTNYILPYKWTLRGSWVLLTSFPSTTTFLRAISYSPLRKAFQRVLISKRG